MRRSHGPAADPLDDADPDRWSSASWRRCSSAGSSSARCGSSTKGRGGSPSGDLDTRIEVRGRHELARLAEAFNQMAADLSAARREVTEWSQKLEEKVVEKTEELGRAQRQVLHMEKMASLGKLSATVAHELNNPLSGMLTYARLVRRELAEQPIEAEIRDELTRYLSLVEKECSRCGGIVQNLLLFARRTGAAMAPVDLNEVVERSLMLVRHHLEISGVKLHSELLAGDSRIVADAGQIAAGPGGPAGQRRRGDEAGWRPAKGN